MGFDIALSQFRTFTFALQAQTPDGNPFALTGQEIVFTIKALITDLDSAKLYQSKTPSGNLAFGTIVFQMNPAQTGVIPVGSQVYDIVACNLNGMVTTLVSGNVTTTASVMRSVP